MERRNFLKNSLLSTAVLAGADATSLAGNLLDFNSAHSFRLRYAPHLGMFEHSAGKDPIDQLQFMADMGFQAFEDNAMMDREVAMQERLAAAMDRLGLQMGVFVVAFDHWPLSTSLASGDEAWRKKFLDSCRLAVETAKRVNAKWATVVPGNYDRRLPVGIQTGNVIEALRRAAEIFEPQNLVMVLEPLSDTPDLFLRNSDQTYMICKAVNSPSCKILFDFWHMQRNEGRLIKNMELCWDEIAYFQTGDEPGRNEPTTGEINFKNIFKYIHSRNYQGIIGMEHGVFGKGKEGEQALIRAYVEADSF